MHPNDARRILGAHKIIGLTIKTLEQAQETGTLPIDYACIGGVFTTTSKQNVEPPLGLSGLNERVKIIRKVAPNLKIGAIAGINASNAASVMQQDIDGVAVLSAITMAHDVERDTLRLHAILNKKT
jgi:thiamine-phosphate pyrophosphorylase